MSPYATSGGGVTFERKVAVNFLAHMLTGGAAELGAGRTVFSVAFQQTPVHVADDLVIRAQLSDESEPSLALALAIRRAPSIVKEQRQESKGRRNLAQREIQDYVGDDVEHRVGLVVAG